MSDYRVLAYDMDSQTLATFDRPRGGDIRLMKADGGTSLGLAAAKGLNLHFWVRDAAAAVWLPRSMTDLSGLITGLSSAPLPHTDSRFVVVPPVKIIGVAEEGDALFLWTMVGIFMICPNSMVFRKVHEVAENMEVVYPYAAFYLPSGNNVHLA